MRFFDFLQFYISATLLISIGLCPANVNAEEVAIEAQINTPSFIDTTHQQISARLINVSQWFDNFFNDPRIDEEPAGTLLRLRGATSKTEGEELSFKGRVKARLELPNLKKRYHLIFSSEDDDLNILSQNATGELNRIDTQNDQTSVALQYTKRILDNFVFSHRLSIRIDKGLNPRLRSRARYLQPISDNSFLNLSQAVFWEYEDGFGQENRIDFDYILRDDQLFRTTGRGLYSEVSNGYVWLLLQQMLVSISEKRAITLGAYIAGETKPKNYLTEYVIFTEYRQNFLKKWLFFEILPELSWPREKNFSSVAAITATLEVRFGKD